MHHNNTLHIHNNICIIICIITIIRISISMHHNPTCIHHHNCYFMHPRDPRSCHNCIHRVHRHLPPSQDLRVPETNLADLSSLVFERNVASKIQVFVTNDPEAILFLTFNVKMCFTESLGNLFFNCTRPNKNQEFRILGWRGVQK